MNRNIFILKYIKYILMTLKVTPVEDSEEFKLIPTRFNKKSADVAVIMPLYGRLQYAIQAVLSVLNQSYQNLVLICVGEPNDDTRMLLEALNDRRIIYLINPKPTLASSFNIAMKYIHKEMPGIKYVTRCDDDDWLLMNKVERARTHLKNHPHIGLLHHGFRITKENGELTADEHIIWRPEELLEYSNIYDGTIMFKTKAVKGIELDEKLPGLPFYDWFIRLHKAGVVIDAIEDYSGYFYRQHDNNNVRKIDIKEVYRLIREKNGIKPEDYECDVMIYYTYMGRESGITASVKHGTRILEEAGYKVKSHACTRHSLYSMKWRVKLCKPKVIIIEKFQLNNDDFILLDEFIDWPCQVIIREHGKNAFSMKFWDKTLRHERTIELANWYDYFNAASVNEEYAEYLQELYDTPVKWVPNTFAKSLMKKAPKFDEGYHVSVLCEIRPLKNVITQLSACQLMGKWARAQGSELYVHILKSTADWGFRKELTERAGRLFFTIVEHDYMSFNDNQRLVSQMDLCLQVSYTETMNYYALEHMMHGVPTLTSEAIHFGEHVPIDDALEIARRGIMILDKTLRVPAKHDAEEFVKKINNQFLKVIKELYDSSV